MLISNIKALKLKVIFISQGDFIAKIKIHRERRILQHGAAIILHYVTFVRLRFVQTHAFGPSAHVRICFGCSVLYCLRKLVARERTCASLIYLVASLPNGSDMAPRLSN